MNNQCGEIAISKNEWCSLLYPHYENPNFTYPTVTRWGIKEMTRQQQQNYVRSIMSQDEANKEDIRTLEQRVAYLENVVNMLLNRK